MEKCTDSNVQISAAILQNYKKKFYCLRLMPNIECVCQEMKTVSD